MKLQNIFAVATVATAAFSGSALAQVTNVSQLRDVSPTEWSYQAVKNLVEKYGCVAGYPNSTFKPGASASREELAALVNSCLDNITQFYTEADARTAAALRVEFSREIAQTNNRVTALEVAAARKNQGVGNYVGMGVLLNSQGTPGNNYSANRTISGAVVQGRYIVKNFNNLNSISFRPYVNFVGSPAGQIGSAGGLGISYDWSLARASSGVSKANIYTGVSYQVPFVNSTDANFQSAVGSKGQVVGVVGLEGRITNSLVGFVDLKLPTTNASNSYGSSNGSYSPVLSSGIAIKF